MRWRAPIRWVREIDLERALRRAREDLGANIRRFRVLRDLTQAELAEAIDVSLRHLQAIELATIAPSLRAVVAVALELEAPLAALFRPAKRAPRPRPGRPKKRRASASTGPARRG